MCTHWYPAGQALIDWLSKPMENQDHSKCSSPLPTPRRFINVPQPSHESPFHKSDLIDLKTHPLRKAHFERSDIYICNFALTLIHEQPWAIKRAKPPSYQGCPPRVSARDSSQHKCSRWKPNRLFSTKKYSRFFARPHGISRLSCNIRSRTRSLTRQKCTIPVIPLTMVKHEVIILFLSNFRLRCRHRRRSNRHGDWQRRWRRWFFVSRSSGRRTKLS